MSDHQAPAGWYTMPSGQRRYWDGQGWGQSEQEAWEERGPIGTAFPIDPPENVTAGPAMSDAAKVEEARGSAWAWAWAGLLFTPLSIGGIVKNVKARRLGSQYGIPVGWGPTLLALGVMVVSVTLGLVVLGYVSVGQSATPGRVVVSSSAGGWSCSEYAADPEATVAKAAKSSNSTLQETRNRLAAVCG